MTRSAAAYQKLAVILGSKIVTRGRTLKEEGQPARVFTQTLLLIPAAKASALNIPDAEVYIDKKTQEEFVATVISQTKPRPKVRVRGPVVPPNPMMEWRPVLGTGALAEGSEVLIICPAHDPKCQCRELMAQASVKIIRTSTFSSFKYGQVVTQLEAYEENERASAAHQGIHKSGTPIPAWMHLLAFVPATEADSLKLVTHTQDGIQIQISATQALAFPADDSSIHSTIPLKSTTPTKPVGAALNLTSKLRDALDMEFDTKFREFDKTYRPDSK